MRVLLDECLPRSLKSHIVTASVISTVPEQGWQGKKNGQLLAEAVGRFDVFITIDRGIRHQQNMAVYAIAVIVLTAPSNRIDDLTPLMAQLNEAITRAVPHAVEHVKPA